MERGCSAFRRWWKSSPNKARNCGVIVRDPRLSLFLLILILKIKVKTKEREKRAQKQRRRDMSPELEERLRSMGFSADERTGFAALMNEGVRHRRDHWERKDKADQEVWVLEMADLVLECGLDRVALGMRKAWTRISFLAGAAEVRQCLPPVPDVAKPRVAFDPNCADCSGSGWKSVPNQKDGHVIRCDCNKRPHRARKSEDESVATWIKQKVAELDARLGMSAAPTRYQAKPATTSAAPAMQFTAEEIQRRKPMERAEAGRVEDEMRARVEGRY
jgi:hypothetical protein